MKTVKYILIHYLNMFREKVSGLREAGSSIPESYEGYKLSSHEVLRYYLCACAILALVGFLFYRSIPLSLLCAAAARLGEPVYAKYSRLARRERLLEGFRDMLYTVSASVAAGRQMPEAVSDAAASLAISHGKDSDICLELSRISAIYGGAHGDMSELFLDFGRRSGLPEISQFASSCSICRRNGGDVEQVCLKSASLLLDRIAFRSELGAVLSRRKLEIAMLLSMPLIVLVFLNLVSYDYISVFYTSFAGRLIMSFALALIVLAAVWSLRIMEVSI